MASMDFRYGLRLARELSIAILFFPTTRPSDFFIFLLLLFALFFIFEKTKQNNELFLLLTKLIFWKKIYKILCRYTETPNNPLILSFLGPSPPPNL